MGLEPGFGTFQFQVFQIVEAALEGSSEFWVWFLFSIANPWGCCRTDEPIRVKAFMSSRLGACHSGFPS